MIKSEAVGVHARDDGPSIVRLQGVPCKSREGNRSEVESSRADNVGEYRGKFEEYYRLNEIRLEYIVPRTPELNGLAERMNQTIMERVRSMLEHVTLSKTFWAEALMKMTYVIKKSPLAHLDGDIPQRVWTDKDVSYQHLKVFD